MVRKHFAGLFMLLLLVAPSVAAEETAKLIQTVISGAKNSAERAEKLVSAAGLAEDLPTKVLLYDEALKQGLKTPKGYSHALSAVEALMKLAPDRTDELQTQRLTVLRRLYRGARKTSAKRSAGARLMATLAALADHKVENRQASQAIKLYREAITVATFLRSNDKADLNDRLKLAHARAMVEKNIKTLLGTLAKAPDDTKSRTRLIFLYLRELDDPATAQKHLTEDVDEALRTYVPLAVKPIEEVDPAVCLELGKWYYQQTTRASADGKRVTLTRARKYYDQYLAATKDTGAKKLQAKIELQKIDKELSKFRISVTIHWTIADTSDVYLNGKPLRKYDPGFRTRKDEAHEIFSAKADLAAGDVFTVGGRRGGSYGFVLVAIDEKGRTVWQSDTKNWQAYVPANKMKWYLPSIAARSTKTKVIVNPDPWWVQNKMRRDMRIKAESIWPGPGSRMGYLVSVVK